MAERTQCPWTRRNTADYAEIVAGDEVIAMVRSGVDADLFAAAPDLLAAAMMLEDAEDKRQHCEECEGGGEPEACGTCFPFFDDARVKRRLAIAKARP